MQGCPKKLCAITRGGINDGHLANDGSEGSASHIYQLNESEPSLRPMQRVRCPYPPKPKSLSYICFGTEGSGSVMVMVAEN